MLELSAADDLAPVGSPEVEDQVGASVDEDLDAQVDVLAWCVETNQ